MITGAPANETPVSAASVSRTPLNGSHVNGHGNGAAVLPHVPAAPATLDDAGRYASQLVSEINRYSQVAAQAAAPVDQNLQDRLADQIEGARTLGTAPAPSAPASALGLFDEALGKMLGSDAEASVVVRPV
jgi:hypothetical protein